MNQFALVAITFAFGLSTVIVARNSLADELNDQN